MWPYLEQRASSWGSESFCPFIRLYWLNECGLWGWRCGVSDGDLRGWKDWGGWGSGGGPWRVRIWWSFCWKISFWEWGCWDKTFSWFLLFNFKSIESRQDKLQIISRTYKFGGRSLWVFGSARSRTFDRSRERRWWTWCKPRWKWPWRGLSPIDLWCLSLLLRRECCRGS